MGARETFGRDLELARRDLGSLLFHWTKAGPIGDARATLHKILRDGALLGSNNKILGSVQVVCFTESPIAEAAALFRVLKRRRGDPGMPEYEPYGIAVQKQWLFERGGRPVIYQPAGEAQDLPEKIRWRHMTYNPCLGGNAVDFTWEREWRIRTNRLPLLPRKCLVIVPTAAEAYEIMGPEFWNDVTDGPSWLATSLIFFGLGRWADGDKRPPST